MLTDPVVDLAGTPIRLRASDPERAEAVAALFRNAERATVSPLGRIEFRAEPSELPASAPDMESEDLALWRTADGVLARGRGGLTAHVDRDAVTIGGSCRALGPAFRALCTIAMTTLLAHHGRHLLHAGAIASGGRALLVAGGTGTGKSTLVFAAIERGWRALSDDVVAVHRSEGVVLAAGLPRPVSVPDDVLGPDALSGLRLVPQDARGRRELPAASNATGAFPVAGVVIVTHGADDKASIEPLPGPDALRAVLQASTSMADPAALPEVFAISGALGRLPGWRLAHGADASARVEAAGRCLDELRPSMTVGAA